jgi:predicted RNase H-like HicB family nuclease
MNYPIIISKDKKSDYGVMVPDLPGCFSAGKTLEQAISNAEEAILTHLEGLIIDGEVIPRPTDIAKYQKQKKYQRACFALVPANLSKLSGKIKRVNLSIPERLLSKFDRTAQSIGETRSGFLVHAALEYIQKTAQKEWPRVVPRT